MNNLVKPPAVLVLSREDPIKELYLMYFMVIQTQKIIKQEDILRVSSLIWN